MPRVVSFMGPFDAGCAPARHRDAGPPPTGRGTVLDVVAQVRSAARSLLEGAGEDFTPTLLAVRQGRVVAAATHADPATLWSVAGQVVGGFGADALALALVGVLPTVPANPRTGRPWAAGEAAAALADDDDAVASGWVTEALLVSVVDRDGGRSSTAQPFRAGPPATSWATDLFDLAAARTEDMLARALEVPPVDPARMPVEQDRARIALDVGTTRALDSRLTAVDSPGGAVLVLTDDDAVARHRSEGLLAWQYVRHAAG